MNPNKNWSKQMLSSLGDKQRHRGHNTLIKVIKRMLGNRRQKGDFWVWLKELCSGVRGKDDGGVLQKHENVTHICADIKKKSVKGS